VSFPIRTTLTTAVHYRADCAETVWVVIRKLVVICHQRVVLRSNVCDAKHNVTLVVIIFYKCKNDIAPNGERCTADMPCSRLSISRHWQRPIVVMALLLLLLLLMMMMMMMISWVNWDIEQCDHRVTSWWRHSHSISSSQHVSRC